MGAWAANTGTGDVNNPKLATDAANNRRNPFMLLHLVLFTAIAGWPDERPRASKYSVN
jgi:hypothetical protein